MRFRAKSLRKLVLPVVVLYATLWLMTATLGAHMVETKAVRAYGTVTDLHTAIPCPCVVRISFAFDHALAAGTSKSTYLWLGDSTCLSRRDAGACKFF